MAWGDTFYDDYASDVRGAEGPDVAHAVADGAALRGVDLSGAYDLERAGIRERLRGLVPHRVRHPVHGRPVTTDLLVDQDGNVHTLAGDYVGRAGELVVGADGQVRGAGGVVVGRVVGGT